MHLLQNLFKWLMLRKRLTVAVEHQAFQNVNKLHQLI